MKTIKIIRACNCKSFVISNRKTSINDINNLIKQMFSEIFTNNLIPRES